MKLKLVFSENVVEGWGKSYRYRVGTIAREVTIVYFHCHFVFAFITVAKLK